jgi:hypothetical protein
MRFILLIIILMFQFGCANHHDEISSDPFPALIFSCLNEYATSGYGQDIEKIDRVYVVYVDKGTFVDIFFSHGDKGSFYKKKNDYKGILSCSGVLDGEFNIYRLRNPYVSEYFIDKPGIGKGVINVDTCGIARERMYFFEPGKVSYQGEKIFNCH